MAPRVSTQVPGLRERKKRRTRELIAATAQRLFLDRGFDAVTVAEVAREAEVAEQTVYNHLPTKEDLVYWRMEAFERELLAAIREREPGESALDAFGRFVLELRGLLADTDPRATERLLELSRMITASPALLAREQQILARYTDSLATLLAEETRAADEVEAWVAANALMGVHRAAIDYVRERIVAGTPAAKLRRDHRARIRRSLALLEGGLGDYRSKADSRRRGGGR